MSGEGREGSASPPAQPVPETPPVYAHSPCIGICLLDDNGKEPLKNPCAGATVAISDAALDAAAQIAALPPEPESR